MNRKSEDPDRDVKEFSKKEIDDVINKIILKNREKLQDFHNKNTDVSPFSIVQNKNNSIYYLKQKKKKKAKDDFFSGEIINDARKKLGKKPVKEEKEIEKPKDKTKPEMEKKKKKLGIKFVKGPKDSQQDQKSLEKKPKELEPQENKPKKQYDQIVDEIDKKIGLMDSEKDFGKIEEPKKLQNKQTIVKETEKKQVKQKKEQSKLKEIIPSQGSKKEKIKTKKPKGSFIKNSFKKDKKGEPNDLDRKETKVNKENGFFKTKSKKKENKKERTEKLQDEIPGKEKDFDKKKTLLDENFVPPAPQVNKPKFRVENFPKSEEQEKNLIEKNIEKTRDKKDDSNKPNLEKKAFNLANKHMEKKEGKESKVGSQNKTPEMKSPSLDVQSDSEHEHVFFDEDISSGWSPHLVEKEKSGADSFMDDAKGEIDLDGYGEVKNVELPKEALKVDSVKLSDLGFSENDWQELDFYSLHEPFSYVEVLREKETLEKRYFLVEAEMNDEEKNVLDFIYETIYNMSIETESLEKMGEDDYLAHQIDEVVKEYNLDITENSFEKILYFMTKKFLGFGKIDPLLKDPNIEDISCDGAKVPIFLYHRKYGSLKSNIQFDDEDELSSFVFKLAQKCGKHISIANPMVDATMPDGSRIQMTLSDEITAHGSTFTIRKFRSDPFSPPDLVEFNTMSAEMIAYMWLAVENGTNMLFAGGTASGKTSTLNALSLFIPPESKIVSIEETREINLPHPNWIPGVARSGFGETSSNNTVGTIDMYDLMKAALRQRPEYILVGEIRGREAYVLFQAMATGHATYSTVHADSAQSLIHRLEGKPINIPRVMLQSLDVVSLHIITKVSNKRARRCKQIIEIIDIDPTTKEILTNEVFRWDPVEDSFVYSGKSYVLERIRAEKDLSRDQITEELKQRKKLVEYMNENNVRGFRQVAHTVSRYLDNPREVLSKIEKEASK